MNIVGSRDTKAAAPIFPCPSSAGAKHRLKRRLLAHTSLGSSVIVPRPPSPAPPEGKRSVERPKQSVPARSDSIEPQANVKTFGSAASASTSSPPELKMTMLPSHCTPADAIEILIRGTVEFLYLTPDPTSSYKLYVLPNYCDEVDSHQGEIITMSKHGIMRQERGGLDAVHFSLGEYLQEYRTYVRLLEIPIFKNYRLW